MTDDTSEQPKREFGNNIHVINGPRVIKACHTCKHERREGDDVGDERWCDASLESLEDTLGDDNKCSYDYDWWEPKAEEPAKEPPPPRMPVLVRFKRWLIR